MTDTPAPGSPHDSTDPNALDWAQTKQACEAGRLVCRVDAGLALQSAARGLEVDARGHFSALAIPALLCAGIAIGWVHSVWWLFDTIPLVAACFCIARRSSIKAVKRAAFKNEGAFHVLRSRGVIWFERNSE